MAAASADSLFVPLPLLWMLPRGKDLRVIQEDTKILALKRYFQRPALCGSGLVRRKKQALVRYSDPPRASVGRARGAGRDVMACNPVFPAPPTAAQGARNGRRLGDGPRRGEVRLAAERRAWRR